MRAAILCAVVLLWCDTAGTAGDESKAQAKILFDRAEASFRVGRFEEALADYTAAYQHLPRHEFLFNIAQCHRNLGDYERAIFFLESYLREGKNVDDRSAIEALIADLSQRLEQQRAREAEPPKPAPDAAATVTVPIFVEAEPEEPPLHERGWFWGVLLGAAAVVGGAIAIGVVASDDGTPRGDFIFDYTE